MITEEALDKIKDKLAKMPSILIYEHWDGVHFQMMGKNDVEDAGAQLLLSIMQVNEDFAEQVKLAAIAYNARKNMT